MKPPAILYCHCQYAQVVPEAVKKAVLKALSDSGQAFEAVPDLCEMAARRDPTMARLAASGPLKVAACFPRAVKWLFHSGGAPLAIEQTQIVNMRALAADDAAAAILDPQLAPNVPAGKTTVADLPVQPLTPA
jgi:hypothetical protein